MVRAKYWSSYGRALAQLRGRHDDAVRALRTAEDIFPTKVRRDPLAREAIAVLLPRTRRDSPAGRELHDMAYRAGLPMGAPLAAPRALVAEVTDARTGRTHSVVRGGLPGRSLSGDVRQ